MKTNILPRHISVVAVCYCLHKPSNESLFATFTSDLKSVLQFGFMYKDVIIRNFTCDLPALALTKRIIGHNGYHACPRCSVVGDNSNARKIMCYVSTDSPPRTDQSFRSRESKEHHKGTSCLEGIIPLHTCRPLHPIRCFT